MSMQAHLDSAALQVGSTMLLSMLPFGNGEHLAPQGSCDTSGQHRLHATPRPPT